MSRIFLSPLILCQSNSAVIPMGSSERYHMNNSNNNRNSSTSLGSISGKDAELGSPNDPNYYHNSSPYSSVKLGSSSKKDKERKKKKYEDILLSSGCSAFIRMIDPRVKRLAGPPVSLCGLGNPINSMAYAHSPNGNNGPLSAKDSNYRGVDNIRSFEQDTLNDVLYLLSHYTQDDHGQLALHFDNLKFKQLRHEFQFKVHHSTLKRRTFNQAIPDNIEKETLVQEINNKFYDVLSS